MSDHKPVHAILQARVKKVNFMQKEQTRTEVEEQVHFGYHLPYLTIIIHSNCKC